MEYLDLIISKILYNLGYLWKNYVEAYKKLQNFWTEDVHSRNVGKSESLKRRASEKLGRTIHPVLQSPITLFF